MKVFEVIIEHEGEDGKIKRMRQYVTQKDNSLEKVVAYFTAHCEQYEDELISVGYILDVVRDIE